MSKCQCLVSNSIPNKGLGTKHRHLSQERIQFSRHKCIYKFTLYHIFFLNTIRYFNNIYDQAASERLKQYSRLVSAPTLCSKFIQTRMIKEPSIVVLKRLSIHSGSFFHCIENILRYFIEMLDRCSI